MRTRERRLVKFLDSIKHKATAVYMLGDIFDFWFEYKRVAPKGFVRVLGRLAELHDRGVRIVMLTGNHDMWVGNYLTEECGIELYTKPQTFTLAGKRVFVAHGDNMNIKGQPMLQLMNAMFRSKCLRKIVSWIIHPDCFMRFGKWWSGKSRKSHSEDYGPEVLDYLVDYALEYGAKTKIDYFVFGHLHYAADVKSNQRILFMGDWHTEPTYIALDNNGKIELKYYN
jgi:UDP-2,3-diacylglucosamine hydrolase